MGCGSMNYQKGFGGLGRDYTTKHSQAITYDTLNYRVNGTGRDTYISLDNGGFFAPYAPDHQPKRGTIGFGEPRPGQPLHKIGPDGSGGKCVGYFPNGSGRDGYIARTNGGFYPAQPVAAYQQTYVARLRSYDREPKYKGRSAFKGKKPSVLKNYKLSSSFMKTLNTDMDSEINEDRDFSRDQGSALEHKTIDVDRESSMNIDNQYMDNALRTIGSTFE